MDRLDHVLVLMRAGHREHLRKARPDRVGFFADAAGYDHATVFRNRFANRFEAFLLGGIEEAAGVDQHDVGTGIIGAHRVAIGAQAGKDAFGIDQSLGAAERNHADLLLVGDRSGGSVHDCARPYTRLILCATAKRGPRTKGMEPMGKIDLTAVFLATLAFFAVGAVWYGILFGKRWQRETGIDEPPTGRGMARIMGLTFAFEMLIVLTLAHLVARTDPAPPVVMMMAVGFALAVMTPLLGINYLHQRKSLALFLIDAGHFVVGMAAAGAVLLAFR